MSFSAQLFKVYSHDDGVFCREVIRRFRKEKREIRAAVCDRVTLARPIFPLFVPYRVDPNTERLGEVLISLKNVKSEEDRGRMLSFLLSDEFADAIEEQLADSGRPPQLEQIYYAKDFEVAVFTILQWLERKKASCPWPITMQDLIARRDQANFERLLNIKIVADVQLDHSSVQ